MGGEKGSMLFCPLSKIDGNHIGSVVNRVLSGKGWGGGGRGGMEGKGSRRHRRSCGLKVGDLYCGWGVSRW